MDFFQKKDIFTIQDQGAFEKMALEVFRHQAVNCNIYARFVSLLGIDYLRIESINDIPFLPVEFFKNHTISSTATNAQTTVFTSSSTTGTGESKHFVTDMAVYEQSFRKGFELFHYQSTK